MTSLFYKTSESVSQGHPDKVCDQIADAVFDYLRTFKKDVQSAVEVSAAAHTLMIFGEIDKDIVGQAPDGENRLKIINLQLSEEIKNIARKTLDSIGYTKEYYNPRIINELVVQSGEINNAVEETEERDPAAGDQGIVTGFATRETEAFHELHYWLANRLAYQLQESHKNGTYSGILQPDLKTQVTVGYDKNHIPQTIDNILVSASHTDKLPYDEFTKKLHDDVLQIVKDTISSDYTLSNKQDLIDNLVDTTVRINPAGAWTQSFGPAADSGLTSRKLVVDNYGAAAPIGGGGQSGKNANKVDRSGACYARWIAKNIIHNDLADRVLIEIGFAIGVPEAVSFNIETYGTEKVPLHNIELFVQYHFGKKHTVKNMIELCDRINSYQTASENGFYTNTSFPWEQLI